MGKNTIQRKDRKAQRPGRAEGRTRETGAGKVSLVEVGRKEQSAGAVIRMLHGGDSN